MGINLIKKKGQYLQYEKIFHQLRIILVIGLSVYFIFILIALMVMVKQYTKYSSIIDEKKRLLAYLAQNSQIEAEFVYFRNKQSQLQNILKSDVNFIPYYNLVRDSLKTATPEPVLNSVVIDKDRSIAFTLSFNSSDQIISFLKAAEGEEFLKNFTQLSISQFAISQSRDITNYELNLTGKLVAINEDKN